jgi:protein tyrosine kinase modulator
MELRRYGEIIRRRWVTASVAFAATVIATLFFVAPREPVYESSGSLVVRPRTIVNPEDRIRAADVLAGGVSIPATYASVAESDLIISKAKEHLPPDADTSGLSVDTQVLIDTNVIRINVRGPDPTLTHAMAEALLDETVNYAIRYDSTYQLATVDTPAVPEGSVGPNKTLLVVLGVLFGLALAVGVALLGEYLRQPSDATAIDDPDTDLRNEVYLRERLREEIARARRTGQPLSVSMLRVAVRTGENDDLSHVLAPSGLRRVARWLQVTAPDDSVLAYVGAGVFVAVLPGVPRGRAEALLEGWEAVVRGLLNWSSQGDLGPRLVLTGGTCDLRGGGFIGSWEVVAVLRRLAVPDQAAVDAIEGSRTEEAVVDAPTVVRPPSKPARTPRAPTAKPAKPRQPAPKRVRTPKAVQTDPVPSTNGDATPRKPRTPARVGPPRQAQSEPSEDPAPEGGSGAGSPEG